MLLVLLAVLAFGMGRGNALDPPQRVTLQLKWRHQFQFAGYYAALEQGYFAEEGLDVTLREGAPDQAPLPSLLTGDAQYAVAGADVLEARLNGESVVVLAVVLQHSPYALLTRRDRGLSRLDQLIGRSVMLHDHQGATEFKAMMLAEGLSLSEVRLIEHSWNNDDLIEGRVDAISAYVSVEPHQIQSRGVEVGIIRPVDYGIDFYGDSLVTTAAEIDEHPARAAAMRRASLRGWEYAFEHVDELIPHILGLPGAAERGLTAEGLRYEANSMRDLALPHLIELGHMNPGRWRRMADTYVALGLAPAFPSLDGFLYDAQPSTDRAPLWGALGAVVVLALLGALILAWNRQLRRLVRDRTLELRQAAEAIGALNTALEERVRERTAQLEVANREIEAFAYSVSHDLRAPLRHLRGYASILIEDHGAEFAGPARVYVDRIGAAAEQMNEVVDALLGLSRLSSSGMSWSPVDLSALAADVAAELRRNQPARDVSFEIAPEVFVEGDPRLLRQAMRNLLENAWKYTSKHASAHIEFGVDERPSAGENGTAATRVFYVRDDGAGFDGQHADQLFRPFRRMHSPAEFEGTGIGLATVQRIIQRHSGRIWAEAAPEQGATFYFTLAGANGPRVEPPR